LAVWPGPSVTSAAAVAVDRVAAAPTWLTGVPLASETPGYPYKVHGALEMFVKSMTW
jgi:hypothetical protein